MSTKTEVNNAPATDADKIASKILHLLKIYPIISPTMLQGGLGPQTRPAVWRPVFEQLIKEGKVIESSYSTTTPADRYNTYSRLSLPGTKISDK